MNSGMTMSELIEQQRAQQARIRLECEVRNAARTLQVDAQTVAALVDHSRVVFRIVNGEACPFQNDGTTLLRGQSGGAMSAREWVEALLPAPAPGAAGTFGPSSVVSVAPAKNPFKRESWNLTEQMRLQRRDPGLAEKLRNEG